MDEQNHLNARKNIEARLTEKAWKDEEFKNELLNNTNNTLENELGIRIPQGIKIKVLEESADEVYLILPRAPEYEKAAELSDAELDEVAGGTVTTYYECIG